MRRHPLRMDSIPMPGDVAPYQDAMTAARAANIN